MARARPEWAAAAGLRLPLVYNTGGYDVPATLRLLGGVVDIYVPDMKYSDDAIGWRLSGARDYARRNRAAVKEMHRQVGGLQLDKRGIALRGVAGEVNRPPTAAEVRAAVKEVRAAGLWRLDGWDIARPSASPSR
jgi:hypothetical protein